MPELICQGCNSSQYPHAFRKDIVKHLYENKDAVPASELETAGNLNTGTPVLPPSWDSSTASTYETRRRSRHFLRKKPRMGPPCYYCCQPEQLY